MDYLKLVCNNAIETGKDQLVKGEGAFYNWQWESGVMLYGLTKAYEVTKDDKIISFIKSWVDTHLDKMDFGYSINTTAPLLSVLTLLKKYPNEVRYFEICQNFADWCLAEAPRAELGVFEHSCTENTYFNQVWADTLFMGAMFLFKWGIYLNKSMYIKEAARQLKLHYYFLSDKQTGLIKHGYDCSGREQKGVLWGRGNAWYASATIEFLTVCPHGTKEYDVIRENFLCHINGMLKYQNEDGTWNTVIDNPDTYEEMSVTAGMCYALFKAVNSGIMNAEYEKTAILGTEALKKDIDKTGKVLSGSGGTCVMPDWRDYNNIGFAYSPFTQGLAVMALAEEQKGGNRL